MKKLQKIRKTLWWPKVFLLILKNQQNKCAALVIIQTMHPTEMVGMICKGVWRITIWISNISTRTEDSQQFVQLSDGRLNSLSSITQS